MFFSNKPLINYPNITFNNTFPEIVDSHKHLGVNFSSNAKWDTQIDFIIDKCAKMIGILRKLKIKISRRCLNQMFLSFVKPILEYADVVLDSCSNDNANRIEKIQLEALRIISGLTRSTHLDSLYGEIGWNPLSQRRKERKLIILFKIIHNLTPRYLTDLVPQTVGHTTTYNLRNNADLRYINNLSFRHHYLCGTLYQLQ